MTWVTSGFTETAPRTASPSINPVARKLTIFGRATRLATSVSAAGLVFVIGRSRWNHKCPVATNARVSRGKWSVLSTSSSRPPIKLLHYEWRQKTCIEQSYAPAYHCRRTVSVRAKLVYDSCQINQPSRGKMWKWIDSVTMNGYNLNIPIDSIMLLSIYESTQVKRMTEMIQSNQSINSIPGDPIKTRRVSWQTISYR